MENVTASWGTYKFNADADKVYHEILDIGDEATPQQIVDKARDESNELHKCFTWDNDKAAEKYRLVEARLVSRSLVFVQREDETTQNLRRRLLVKTDNTAQSGYKSVLKVVRNEDEYQKLLQTAYAELQAFKARYKHLSELQEIIELIP